MPQTQLGGKQNEYPLTEARRLNEYKSAIVSSKTSLSEGEKIQVDGILCCFRIIAGSGTVGHDSD